MERYYNENIKDAILFAKAGAKVTKNLSTGVFNNVDEGAAILLTGVYYLDPSSRDDYMYYETASGTYAVVTISDPEWYKPNLTDEEYNSILFVLKPAKHPNIEGDYKRLLIYGGIAAGILILLKSL